MRTRASLFLALGLLGAIASVAGCSLLNAPDDIRDATTSGGGGTGGGGGAPPSCTVDGDCAQLVNECTDATCEAGACATTFKPADTACGSAPADSCDVADTCDGKGQCVNATMPDGTYCDDCAAGSGNCARCSAGACGNCTGRATEKSFRTPASADGWTLTGSWEIRPATPPQSPPGSNQCSDGFDNDGDGLADLADPDCSSSQDPYEFTPACSDGFDNDGDMLVDFPNDPGCSSASDEDESVEGEIVFDHPVLGSDGNRAHAYVKPNGQFEGSFALSPPTVLPSELRFKSWNLDEGFYYDKKAVRITTDGTNFTTVAICQQPMGACAAEGATCNVNSDCCSSLCINSVCAPAPAFCTPVGTREADDWDDIVLPVPPSLVGQVGQVQFKYDTQDSCCNFERGWFVDALNFATECGCANAGDCGYLNGDCATGACDAGTSECRLAPKSLGASCTSDGTADCSNPSCDANGFCNLNGLVLEGSACTTCTDPDGQCATCAEGQCTDCWPVQTFGWNDNAYDNFDASEWVFTGDWAIGSCTPQNSVTPTQQLCFDYLYNEQQNDPHSAPMLGNNGSRVPGGTTSEIEAGTATSSPTVIPSTLTFNSWHQDRGGNDTFNLRDKKQILISVDDGMTWNVLLDCDGNTMTAFCKPWPTPSTNRSDLDWDAISLPVPANLAGQVGLVRFVYDTVDAGGGWERGWFIDDINISRCD